MLLLCSCTQNDNVVNLDEDTALDIPPEYSGVHQYCASLGHKANHAPSPPPGHDHDRTDNRSDGHPPPPPPPPPPLGGGGRWCNCEYSWCEHPRFGRVVCVRTLRAVAPGEELTVDYKFVDETPPWFKREGEGKGGGGGGAEKQTQAQASMRKKRKRGSGR